MATSISTLQERIADLLGAAVGDQELEAETLLADINQVHRFDIPEQVGGGRFTERIFVLVAADNTGRIDINDGISVSPSGSYGAIVHPWARGLFSGQSATKDLVVYTSHMDFWSDYDPNVTTSGTPESILIQGTTFHVRPAPNALYGVYLDAIKHRDALAQNDSISLDYEGMTHADPDIKTIKF
jgi:hypothetical protein